MLKVYKKQQKKCETFDEERETRDLRIFSLHFFNIQLNCISKFVPAHRITCFERNTFQCCLKIKKPVKFP